MRESKKICAPSLLFSAASPCPPASEILSVCILFWNIALLFLYWP
jgi:hypothetical protein